MATSPVVRTRTPLLFTAPPDRKEFFNGNLVLQGGWTTHQREVKASPEDIVAIIQALKNDLNPIAQELYRVATNPNASKQKLVVVEGIHRANTAQPLHLSVYLDVGKGLPKLHINVGPNKEYIDLSENLAPYSAYIQKPGQAPSTAVVPPPARTNGA